MANLKDISRSVSEMGYSERLGHIVNIRGLRKIKPVRRAKPRKEPKPKKPRKSRAEGDVLLDNILALPPDERINYLKALDLPLDLLEGLS